MISTALVKVLHKMRTWIAAQKIHSTLYKGTINKQVTLCLQGVFLNLQPYVPADAFSDQVLQLVFI